jgi:probable phosphoglycerate mutase
MPDSTLYLIRHGETAFNVEGRYQGQQDSPLTARGRAQARRHGILLKALIGAPEAWRMVASPLGRTLATARIICAELGRPEGAIETDARLKEIAFGEWEGLTAREIEARYPDAWAAWEADRWHHLRPGGESYAQLAARIGAFLRDAEVDAIVVGHGGAGRVLRGLYGRLAQDEILTLDEPQDAIFRLNQGTVARFEHEEAGEGE